MAVSVTVVHPTPADGTFSAAGEAAWEAGHTVSDAVANQSSNGSVSFKDAALATTATTGFLMIPAMEGVPTGVPADIPTGQVPVTFDKTNNDIYAYDGGWLPSSPGVDTANSPAANEFARFTDADTIEGRTTTEVKSDLGLVIGTNVQAWAANLDEYAAVNPTAAGLALLDDAAASDQRTTLGLGTIATQAASAVAITGGTISGITDLAVADGGTGLSAGTSGGILAFTAAGTLASSAALGATQVVLGGGAGAAPNSSANLTFSAGLLNQSGSAAAGFIYNNIVNTDASGAAAAVVNNDIGSYWNFVAHGTTFAGSLLGVTRAGTQMLYSNGALSAIGTIDAFPLVLSTNNAERVRLLSGGNAGFGVTVPTAVVHLKAGTATASTAPFKFTSGTLLTTAEAGAVEFLTDKYYGTITTGAVRHTFVTLESAAQTFSNDVSVPDEAYGVGWNGSLEVPTKNAVYDKIETTQPALSVATAGADAAPAMAVNTFYLCDISGYTADRTATLPGTAAVGDRIGIYLTEGDTAFELLITATAGDTLNLVAGGTEWSRLFIRNEFVIFRCTVANTTWVVEQDLRIPMTGLLQLTTACATDEAAATLVFASAHSGVWTAAVDVGSVCTTSTDKITFRRACRAKISAGGLTAADVADQSQFAVHIIKNGTTGLSDGTKYASGAAWTQAQIVPFPLSFAAGDYIQHKYQSSQGTRGMYGDSGQVLSYLLAEECLP